MSTDKTMVVVGIVDHLVNKYEDGSPEVTLSISCSRNRIAPNRVLLCVGSENALLKKGGLSPLKYNEILIESGFASIPRRKKEDIKKMIAEIMSKNKDIVDEKIMAILIGEEEALTTIG
ncbi:MAG: hypothetical protein KAQ87_05140 [Candidatus Pacebacteria bacterium]|nr:hypothetical protein [Candidatus Paceibacterota bacterium]